MPVNNKTVIIIAGPTAVGKTAVAIELAKYFQTEIISADSRQCYKELSIGVARPGEDELKEIKHHFIASHSIHDEITAAGFEQYAMQKANELFAKHDTIIMTGGTGLYIKAFCEGLDAIPEIPGDIREEIIKKYEQYGLEWLQGEIKEKDPAFFEKGETKNPQRLMRALEVLEATGHSVLHFRKGEKAERVFNIVKICLELPREELVNRINVRVNAMMSSGLLSEVKELIPYRELNALQTVGYKELFDYLDNKISLPEAVELIKNNTRQYAKRQMTWFRKDKSFNWFHPGDIESIVDFCSK